MSAGLLLRLGRTSNLPTVFSNVLTGVMLSRSAVGWPLAIAYMLAMSLFYEGGMFLNDAFDRGWDAQHRPERPIPAGLISARTVFSIGFSLLLAGILLTAFLSSAEGGFNLPALLSALLLAGNIVLYDLHHKGNAFGPLLMGGCRVLVYVTVLLSLRGRFDTQVIACVLGLLGYLMGLTYVARQENLRELSNLWPLPLLVAPLLVAFPRALGLPLLCFVLLIAWLVVCLRMLLVQGKRDIPGAVGRLIAGVSLVDALFVASARPDFALLCLVCFALTLLLQRKIAGT